MCGKKALWSTAKMLSIQFSDYYMKLNKTAKEKYLSELSMLDIHDLYLLKGQNFTEDLAALPPLKQETLDVVSCT